MEVTKEGQLNKSEVKILVVDDREDNLFSIETILERDNYTIRKANSGRAALKMLLSEQDFTLILMDVQMPDMNGFETATLIYQREKLKNIPIIFITAHNQDEEYMFEGYKMGAVDFIYKPINPELMRFKVSVFADLYRKNFQLTQQEKKLLAANESLEKEIEERRNTEEKIRLLNYQLLQNNEELKMINEELDRFAYVASHDLQEPLRKIIMFSDILKMKMDEKLELDVHKTLGKIILSSNRMQSLIKDLLKFSRHSSAVEDFSLVNLNEIVTDVLSDLEAEIQRREAQVHYESLPTIQAIPSQLRQLFQNLIGNALKFSKPNTSPKIQIYSEVLEDIKSLDSQGNNLAQTCYRIFIKDNGIGFDTKYADDIFVVFKRLHSYHEFEGSGIGLSICKKIVDKHKGTIKAEGVLNEGATFIITLPEGQQQDTKSSLKNAVLVK
jgi:hypothetical protein